MAAASSAAAARGGPGGRTSARSMQPARAGRRGRGRGQEAAEAGVRPGEPGGQLLAGADLEGREPGRPEHISGERVGLVHDAADDGPHDPARPATTGLDTTGAPTRSAALLY